VPAPGAGAVIAVDIGGTAMKGAVVSDDDIARELVRPTPVSQGPDAVIAAIQAMVTELGAAGPPGAPRPQAVGLVVPGVVDAERGVAVFSANVGLRDVPLRDLVQSEMGLPTTVEHDVHAAGVAERTVGAAAGVDDHLVAVIGTGIAGVIHAGGGQVRGARRIAGELGHIPVWPNGEHCACGQRGCLERYASAAAIARRYAALGGQPGTSAHAVGQRRERDAAAGRAWREASQALAIALVTCTMLLDPALIVIAGGLSAAGDALLAPVQEELAARVAWREPPPLRLSPLGGRAGLIGAALLAQRLV
jgi:glucokinase